ncbi:hypothetical protein JTE90_012865 [Oedothorax gibbosus]|uniref:Uncharacterized protein n=1 Tax=Oedothorax gibbosus TaxID=931172 RepID=A0AAV6UPI1_9ARAC|nr:hypothetical protein JTE90_012865 [Oedothorax gibbosus]
MLLPSQITNADCFSDVRSVRNYVNTLDKDECIKLDYKKEINPKILWRSCKLKVFQVKLSKKRKSTRMTPRR